MNTSNFRIRPNRLSITPKRQGKTMQQLLHDKVNRHFVAKQNDTYIQNFEKKQNAFRISRATKTKIFDSINNLYALSDKRTITMANGKPLYNFKNAFITLTLPSVQKHTDVKIKKSCINQLLIELKKHYQVENWVWKAELQGNKNIHFHLITDKYIDYQALRRRWNRIINKLGYVDAYADKMQKLTVKDYHKMRCKYKEVPFSDSAKAYAKGKQSKWRNPNSVDVRSVQSSNDLGAYLAKYIAKDIDKEITDEKELIRGTMFGRVWSRSYSLVGLDKVNCIDPIEWKNLIKYLNSGVKEVFKLVGDYFTVFYYQLDKLPNYLKLELRSFFKASASFLGYQLPYLV